MTPAHAWAALAVAALVAGAAWAWRRRDRPPADRLLAAILPLAVLAAVAEVAPWVAALPAGDMTASRVVPGVALATGHPIYAGWDDGPIIDFMYGPLAAVAYTPAALAATPSGAIAIAGLINAVAFFAPIAWLHARFVGGLAGAAAMMAFVLLVCRDPGLAFSGLTIHADAPALGLAAVACGALAAGTAGWRLPLSAAALVLAAWTKQTVAPMAVVLPVYVLVTGGATAARRYCAWIVAIGLAVSVVLLLAFDPAAMFLNAVTILRRYAWYGDAGGGRLTGLWVSARALLATQGPTVVVLAALVAASAREAGGMRRWLADEPWVPLLLVGLALVPMAVLGGVKVGGYLNTQSVASYFFAAVTTLGTARVAARARVPLGRALLVILLGVLVARPLLRPDTPDRLARAVIDLAAWRTNEQERAYEYARAHPGEVYLPWNPLAALLAEGRLDSNEIGAWNWDMAGLPIGDAQWRRWVPASARYLAFRAAAGGLQWLPWPTRRLPEFRERVELPELPGWIVYRRDTP